MPRELAHAPLGPAALVRGLTAACVLALFAVSAGEKILYSFARLTPDPVDDTAVFWSESAFHYRYARMAARGEELPAHDVRAQHPEGVDPRREYTLLMERVTGAAFRLVGGLATVPFHFFVIIFSALVSSLAVPAFFAAASAVSRSRLAALLTTSVYALNPAPGSRFAGTFVYEAFALPWLILGVAGLVAALDDRRDERARRLASIAAAASLAVALATWHFANFVLLVLVVAIGARYAARFRDRPACDAAMRALAVVGAACLAAGVALPVLRAGRFAFSAPMTTACALLLAHAARVRWDLSRPRWAAAAALGASAGLALGALAGSGAYGHVDALLGAKLAHLLAKPSDPALLSEAARLLWMPPLESLRARDALFAFLPLAPLLLIPLLERKRAAGEPFLQACAVAFILGAMMVSRLLGLAVLFTALAALSRLEGMRRRGLAAAALVAALALANADFFSPPGSEKPFGDPVRRRAMLDWIRSHSRPDDAFASNFALASSILTYADRPTLLNPKFETPSTRRKAGEFLAALAGRDEDLLGYCTRYGARYLVYESAFALDDSLESMRYAANAMTLSTASAGYRLHFEPSAFRGLRLVYEDGDYRIFRVLRPVGDEGAQGFLPRRDPVYDRGEFTSERRSLAPGDARALVARLARRRALVASAFELDRSGEPGAAEDALRTVLADFPNDAETWTDLGILRSRAGDSRGALESLERAIAADPNDRRAARVRARVNEL